MLRIVLRLCILYTCLILIMANQGLSGEHFRASHSLFCRKKDEEKEASDFSFDSDDLVDNPSFVVHSEDR